MWTRGAHCTSEVGLLQLGNSIKVTALCMQPWLANEHFLCWQRRGLIKINMCLRDTFRSLWIPIKLWGTKGVCIISREEVDLTVYIAIMFTVQRCDVYRILKSPSFNLSTLSLLGFVFSSSSFTSFFFFFGRVWLSRLTAAEDTNYRVWERLQVLCRSCWCFISAAGCWGCNRWQRGAQMCWLHYRR